MTPLIFAALAGLCPPEAEALRNAADVFESHYVLQAEAGAIAADVRSAAASLPASSACLPAEEFARAATDLLRDISRDKHVMVEAAGEGDEADSAWIAKWYADAPKTGYGVRKVEVLKGNIGYLKLSTFYDMPETWDRYGAALTLLQDTDGLVLDLRGNGGGSPEGELRIQWSFLPDGHVPPLVMDRAGVHEERGVPPIDWPRYLPDKPVAILIDGRTFSAAEAVSYGLQTTGRAFVVGQSSGGGAHMVGDPIAIGNGYWIRMPNERPISPLTGGNWEGSGVAPDVVTTPEEALDAAIAEIQRRLAG